MLTLHGLWNTDLKCVFPPLPKGLQVPAPVDELELAH